MSASRRGLAPVAYSSARALGDRLGAAPAGELETASHIAPRTVEFHLTGVYRKLGRTARAELAAALAGPDPA